MRVILLTNHYDQKPYEIVSDIVPEGFELKMLPEATRECLLKMAPDVDYFLVSGRLPVDEEVLNTAVKLRMIQRTGVGMDVFDLNTVRRKEIPLYVNQGVNAQSVAEHTMLLMLASLKRLPAINYDTKSGIWKKQQQGLTTYEMAGRTVGIVGMGNIGRRVARMLKGFDVQTIYYDEKALSNSQETELGARKVKMDELLSESDIITLHCPLTKHTEHLVNKESIQSMKEGVIIINTARGALIDEQDLADAVESGKVVCAGVDVYETEPPKHSRLLTLENVISTPHIGGITYNSFQRMMHGAMRNIALYEAGKLDEIEQYRYKG